MSSQENPQSGQTTPSAGPLRRNSYSRRAWNAFDAWQEHVRKSAVNIGVAFPTRPDRDLRRATVPG